MSDDENLVLGASSIRSIAKPSIEAFSPTENACLNLKILQSLTASDEIGGNLNQIKPAAIREAVEGNLWRDSEVHIVNTDAMSIVLPRHVMSADYPRGTRAVQDPHRESLVV